MQNKGFYLMAILYVSLLWAFMLDFFHDSNWMSTTIQYAPMALAWIIIIVMAIFEAVNKDKMDEASVSKREGNEKSMKLLALIFLWAAVISMNFIAGTPGMDLLNIHRPEFWIFLILLPLLTAFNYRRKTDGVA